MSPAARRSRGDTVDPVAAGEAAVLVVRLDGDQEDVVGALRPAGLPVAEVSAEVAVAADGADLVVIVVDPPGRAALELCERLLGAAAVTAAVLVLFTDDPGADMTVAALRAGADSCLAPPVAPEVVAATVQALTRRGAAARDEADRRGIAQNAMHRAPVVGLLATDEQGQVVAANDRLRAMPVWAEPGTGFSVQRALPGPLGAVLHAMVERVVATGEQQYEEVAVGEADQRTHWQVRAFAVASPSGRIRGVEAVLADVTELQRTLDRLRASEQRWRAVWQSPSTGIAVRDHRARLLECNDAYARMFGAACPEEMVGTDFSAMLAPEDAERVYRAFAARWEEGSSEVVVDERLLHRRDGRELVWSGTITNLYDADGRAVARLSLNWDITERKRLERDLARAQRLDALGRLAGGCAHDVNNMMAVILGYADLVAGELGPDHPLHPELREIRRAAEHSASLAGDLLAFGRQQVLERRPLVAAECVTGLSNLLRRTMGQVELVTEDASAGAVVLGDRAQLETVIINLVTNARDATPPGGRVTLRTEVGPAAPGAPAGVVVISVTDTGVGMEEHVRERIFEPFFTTKSRSEGTGLGLATVAGIVDQMGGSVTVQSHAGRGSRFEVSLPRLAAPVGRGTADEGDAGEAGEEPAGPHGRTVVVVEDQVALRRLVERMLTAEGHRVFTAATAAEALEVLTREGDNVDLLLVDMSLPDLPGGELAARALRDHPGLRVVFTSGYAGEQAAGQGVAAGHGFLAKPYGIGDLRQAIRAAFAGAD